MRKPPRHSSSTITAGPFAYYWSGKPFSDAQAHAGIVREAGPGRRGPALHALRHTFSVERLLAWCRAGSTCVRNCPICRCNLGHVGWWKRIATVGHTGAINYRRREIRPIYRIGRRRIERDNPISNPLLAARCCNPSSPSTWLVPPARQPADGGQLPRHLPVAAPFLQQSTRKEPAISVSATRRARDF